MSHFCLVVCSAIGRSTSGVCIALVLGIIVTAAGGGGGRQEKGVM